MLSRHPLGAVDLILPVGIVVAATGYFYTALTLLGVWGWLNKRRALRFKQLQQAGGTVRADTPTFQDRGESLRRRLLIDGTAGDAQDVDHPYIPEAANGPCLVCGLARSYRRHYGASVPQGATGSC